MYCADSGRKERSEILGGSRPMSSLAGAELEMASRRASH